MSGVMIPAMATLNFNEKFNQIPLQRLSKPKEIADVVVFLCSDQAQMITGQNIIVDGGCAAVGGIKMTKVKIKVLKTTCFKELAMAYGHSENYHACPIFKEGDEFISEDPFGNAMPEGFCHMAWQSLFTPVSVLAGGGKVLGLEEKHIVCCSDGLRPVIFELSREDEEK